MASFLNMVDKLVCILVKHYCSSRPIFEANRRLIFYSLYNCKLYECRRNKRRNEFTHFVHEIDCG